MTEFVMPRLSDSMEEGTILKWLRSDGDQVSPGDELLEVETDKATMTCEADADGYLRIAAREGETVPVGNVIAHVLASADEVPPGPPLEEAVGARSASATAVAVASVSAAGTSVKVSPLARRIAHESGLDLADLIGTGPGGRIVRADVHRGLAAPPVAASSRAAAPTQSTARGETTVVELTRIQQVVARRMAEAKATIPEFSLTTDVRMDAANQLRAQLKASDAPVSFNDMVIKAAAKALREYPMANGSYRDGHFELYDRVNVGFAVAVAGALLVPTIPDADRLPLTAIAESSRALALKARDGQLTPPELAGGTFTVSNLGMYGVTNFTAVINSPQAAILAVGALAKTPMVSEGSVVPGLVMPITLTCDHRILYGADAAQFLARVREFLEQPMSLLV